MTSSKATSTFSGIRCMALDRIGCEERKNVIIHPGILVRDWTSILWLSMRRDKRGIEKRRERWERGRQTMRERQRERETERDTREIRELRERKTDHERETREMRERERERGGDRHERLERSQESKWMMEYTSSELYGRKYTHENTRTHLHNKHFIHVLVRIITTCTCVLSINLGVYTDDLLSSGRGMWIIIMIKAYMYL